MASSNQSGFPGPPSGINSSPGGTPGMSSPRPGFTGPGTPSQMGTPPGLPPPGPPPQMTSPTKDINAASICRMGQETTQDIVSKAADLFQHLKSLQIPNGVNYSPQMHTERKGKFDEQTRQTAMMLKRIRIIYDKVNETTTHTEGKTVEELLPIEENGEVKGERPKVNESMEYATEEHRKLIEQIRIKNRQLKEIIDQSRTIVWEINTMMAMRKP